MPDAQTTELTDAQQVAAGLRQLADLLDANPNLPGTRYAFTNINLFPRTKEGVAAWARAAMRQAGKASKHQSDKWAGVNVDCGFVNVVVNIEREEVCERIVTGTREVTKEVPDPDLLATVPLVSVTETVEDVEWRCMPILAELDGAVAA